MKKEYFIEKKTGNLIIVNSDSKSEALTFGIKDADQYDFECMVVSPKEYHQTLCGDGFLGVYCTKTTHKKALKLLLSWVDSPILDLLNIKGVAQ